MPKAIKTVKKKEVKYVSYKLTKLILPKNPFLYKLRRVKWLLDNYNRLLEVDPLAIDSKKYFDLLDQYTLMLEEATKKGLHTREGRRNAGKRMDSSDVDSLSDKDTAPKVGGDLPFGLGVGVSADNTTS